MIRVATDLDIPRIVEMGSRSLREGPYNDMIDDNPEASALLAINVLKSQNGTILVSEEDGKLVGLLAFFLYPHYFDGKPTGSELMWWVEPEYRKSFTAVALLRAAEAMARKDGAVRMQFTAPTEAVAQAYASLGYRAIEVSYQKDFS